LSVGVISGLLIGLLIVVAPAHETVINIHDPSPTSYSLFGNSIDSANGFLIVGQPFHNGESGVAFVFDATTGSLIRTLAGPSTQSGTAFGWSVEISGSLVFVGAPGETVNGVDSAGRVYIFNLGTGALLKTLVSTSPEHLGDFGRAVDTSDGLLAVGAPFEMVGGVQAGRVHVFDIRTGTEIMNLATPNPVGDRNNVGGAFGATVNIADDHVIVGAPAENQLSGRAYVFNIATGALVSTLVSPNSPLVSYFGSSVAVKDDRAFVGSPFETLDLVTFFGRVYVFDLATGAPVKNFTSPNTHTLVPGSSDGFGRSITLAGNSLIVGAPEDPVNTTTAGRVYVFGAESGKLKSTLASPETGVSGSFGCFGNAVDSAKGRIFVGAPCQAVNGQLWAGSVYIFS
jgi:WD40 repeat protein